MDSSFLDTKFGSRLSFPEDRTVGWIRFIPLQSWDLFCKDELLDELEETPATGAIEVPVGVRTSLSVSKEAGIDLSFLAQLPPDAINALSCVNGAINNTHVQYIKDMTGLLCLDLSGSSVTNRGLSLLSTLNQLEYLDLTGLNLTDSAVDPLRSLIWLKRLSLAYTNISASAALSMLSSMHGLHSLDLSGIALGEKANGLSLLSALVDLQLESCELTDESTAFLNSLSGLEKLLLSSNDLLTDACVGNLVNLNSLRELDLSFSDIGDASVARLADFIQLETLELSGTDITNGALLHLPKLPKLRALFIGYTQIDDSELQALVHLPNLKELDLSDTKITDAGAAVLRNCRSLQTLTLSSTKVTDSCLAVLAEMERLESVDLSGTQTTEQGREQLARRIKEIIFRINEEQAHNQTDHASVPEEINEDQRIISFPLNVSLGYISYADESLSMIGSWCDAYGHDPDEFIDSAKGNIVVSRNRPVVLSPSNELKTDMSLLARISSDDLQGFDFEYADQISEKDFEQLSRCKGVRILNLNNTQCSDATLKMIANSLSELQQLRIGSTRVSKSSLSLLGKLRKLRLLETSNLPLGSLEGVSHLKELAILIAPQCDIDNKGLAPISGLTQIRGLDLNGNNLSQEGLRHLRALSELIDLDLSLTDLTDVEMLEIAKLTKLKMLNLGWGEITDSGMQQIRHLRELRKLDLSSCHKITEVGISQLSALPALTCLELYKASITMDVARALSRLSPLQYLNLTESTIDDDGLLQLTQLSSLKYICLDGTDVSPDGIERFKSQMAGRVIEVDFDPEVGRDDDKLVSYSSEIGNDSSQETKDKSSSAKRSFWSRIFNWK